MSINHVHQLAAGSAALVALVLATLWLAVVGSFWLGVEFGLRIARRSSPR